MGQYETKLLDHCYLHTYDELFDHVYSSVGNISLMGQYENKLLDYCFLHTYDELHLCGLTLLYSLKLHSCSR